MGVLFLWVCFLAVLMGLAATVAVLVREVRRHVGLRRADAVEAEAAELREKAHIGTGVPAAGAIAAPPAESPLAAAVVPTARRGLGSQLAGAGAGTDSASRRPVADRGLGATATAARGGLSPHGGLGSRPHA